METGPVIEIVSVEAPAYIQDDLRRARELIATLRPGPVSGDEHVPRIDSSVFLNFAAKAAREDRDLLERLAR